MAWSHDSKYLATKNDNTPNCVYIWDMTTLQLNVLLIHSKTIKSMQWSPKSLHLVIATGSPRIFIWSMGGASVCDIPADSGATKEFNVSKIKWNPNGKSIVVADKSTQMMVAYPHL